MSNEEEWSRWDETKATILELLIHALPIIVIPLSLLQDLISAIRGEPAITTLDLSRHNRVKGDKRE